MRCERCENNEAKVHISTLLHGGGAHHETHLCPDCAQVADAAAPFLKPIAEPIPTASSRVATTIPQHVRSKIREVDEALVAIDPILQHFCEHRAYALEKGSELWPSRGLWSRAEIVRYLNLTTDTRFSDIIKAGFQPHMPWSLYATAMFRMEPGKPFRTLTIDIFRGLPFSRLPAVLPDELDRAYSILHELTSDDVLTRGGLAHGRPKPFQSGPW